MNLAQEVINHDYPANILLHLENLEFHFMVKCSLRAPTIVCGALVALVCWGVDSASATYAPHTTVGALKLG